MEKNTLEAFVVKRKKVLLPALNIENFWNSTYWCSVKTSRRALKGEILIESKEEKVNDYYLYGTEIPVVFCYPNYHEETRPFMEICIGVETKKWEVSSSMKKSHPDGKFHYNGKCITNEDVIHWLENEINIESMKRVREWAIRYGEDCQKRLEDMKKRQEEEAPRLEAMRRQREEEQAQKVKKMINKRNELISKYQ